MINKKTLSEEQPIVDGEKWLRCTTCDVEPVLLAKDYEVVEI